MSKQTKPTIEDYRKFLIWHLFTQCKRNSAQVITVLGMFDALCQSTGAESAFVHILDDYGDIDIDKAKSLVAYASTQISDYIEKNLRHKIAGTTIHIEKNEIARLKRTCQRYITNLKTMNTGGGLTFRGKDISLSDDEFANATKTETELCTALASTTASFENKKNNLGLFVEFAR